MKLSKEQKDSLSQKLSMPWGIVELLCDGRRVSLQVQRFKQMTYRVMTYVDGTFKYAWVNGTGEPAPEAKFLRKSVRANVSPAKRKEYERQFGKRFCKSHDFINGSTTIYMPDWSSGKAAISHLCKVCDSVEIAEPLAIGHDFETDGSLEKLLGIDE